MSAPATPHPAELRAEADRCDLEALELYEAGQQLRAQAELLDGQIRAKRAEAAVLRDRAARVVVEAERKPPKAAPLDPATAMVTIAAQDLGGEFTAGDLAEIVEIRDIARVIRILNYLAGMGEVVVIEPDFPQDPLHYRSVDPLEARVRDMARELGTFTMQQWADALEMEPGVLDYYRERMLERGSLVAFEDGGFMYLRPDPERVVRERRRPPERDPPAGLDAPRRGTPVRLVDHGERGRLASTPGNRLRIKLRDKAHQNMQDARQSRSERDRARSQRDKQSGGKSNKRGGKRK